VCRRACTRTLRHTECLTALMLNGPDPWNRRRNIVSQSYPAFFITGPLNINLAITGGSIGGG